MTCSTLEMWRWLQETPKVATSFFRSSRVSLPQSSSSLSVTVSFPDHSLEGVADAGNSCLNCLTVELAMKRWHCFSYFSTSWLVLALHTRKQARECDLQHRIYLPDIFRKFVANSFQVKDVEEWDFFIYEHLEVCLEAAILTPPTFTKQ